MKKTKKKKSDKKKPTLLGGATKSLKKLGKGTAASIGKLSTTQKILAGATLGALGVRYVVKQLGKNKAAKAVETAPGADSALQDDAAVAEHNLTSLEEETEA